MALVGFARVSTAAQDLDLQIKALEEAGCSKIFQGKHSGKAESNQAALESLLDYIREGDTVVVTKLDRLGRSLTQVLRTLDHFQENEVGFKCLDQNIDTTKNNDPMARAMIQLLGIFAELERNFIVSRTQEGRKATGRLGGRPPKLSDDEKRAVKKSFEAGESKAALSRQYGVSRLTIKRIVEAPDKKSA